MSKFKVFIDTPTDTNCMSAESFSADSQIKNGFRAGTSSSSIRVNSALRQANLVSAALMNIVDTEEELDLRSDVSSVETKINSYLDDKYFVKNSDKIGTSDFAEDAECPNAKAVNNLEIKEDRNGFIEIENNILQTKISVSSGGDDSENTPLRLTLSENFNYGDTIEIWWELSDKGIQGKSTAVFTGYEGSGEKELSFSMVSCPQISNAKLITIRGYALSSNIIRIHKMYSDVGELDLYPTISRVVRIKDNFV